VLKVAQWLNPALQRCIVINEDWVYKMFLHVVTESMGLRETNVQNVHDSFNSESKGKSFFCIFQNSLWVRLYLAYYFEIN